MNKSSSTVVGDTPSVVSTRCEGHTSPLGVASARPLLNWMLQADGRNRSQRAWHIIVASSLEKLHPDKADLWDSGKIISSATTTAYDGVPLRSRQGCYWGVRVWDENDQPSAFSTPQYWEMALLEPSDWKAQWVGYPAGWVGRALYFRHPFELAKPVAYARAYCAGLGYHELRINGEKVGNNVLDPGWTEYAKRILYVTHDIGTNLQQGANVVAAIVGHGWYGAPCLKLQLEIFYTDGTSETIYTQGGQTNPQKLWYVSSGPLLADSIYDGETYDARLEVDGWDRPGVLTPLSRQSMWDTAVPVTAPSGTLVAQTIEPIQVVETFRPVSLEEPQPGLFVFDAGRNLAGWVRLQASAQRGTCVTLRFAETLNEDGTVNQLPLRKAAATDTCILSGKSQEIWEPRFTYHGFRYVQLEGLPPKSVNLDTILIRVVRSAVTPAGSFTCSNELLNRIQTAVVNTEASNLHSVPTDCPQRNERMGWLNDMTVRAEQALYNFNLQNFYSKWLQDVADTQDDQGRITDTAPFKWGKRPADPVSISYLLIAWLCYKHYNDTSLIHRHFDGFERWTNYLLSRSENFILSYSSWGDWAPPKNYAIQGSDGGGAISIATPAALISTGYLYYHAKLLSQMADLLNRPQTSTKWAACAKNIAEAFNKNFWDEDTGGYGSNNQACNALALSLRMPSAERTPRVVANLVADVERHDWHLTTGNLCTKYLLEVLTEHGHVETAFKLATQTTYPSWGYMLANGATTLWERWENLTGASMNSHNHPMHGSVSSWFYKHLAGIRLEGNADGSPRITIRPSIPKDLQWVKGSYEASFGRIESAWEQTAQKIILRITIPTNTQAVIFLPATSTLAVTESGLPLQSRFTLHPQQTTNTICIEAGSGEYVFEITQH